ncbi:MAG: NAD(P)H-dependent glycerol-3-phosphate dehydrogenase [bacterium]
MKLHIIGAGNWGTTLAHLFSKENEVLLWTHTIKHAQSINSDSENKMYLPGLKLSKNIIAVKSFSVEIDSDDIVLLVVPSSALPGVADELKNRMNGQTIICATKGFEHQTMRTMGEVINAKLPDSPLIALSGPNIARELAQGKPTKAVLASENLIAVTRVVKYLKNDLLAFEVSRDIKGIELCAALKGIIAIGVGIADGLDLGDNFTALLMTYGLREFVAIAEFLGIQQKTIYGIAGLGDLIATCLSKNSRNRKFGYLLGKGYKTEEALKEVGMVVEGVQMTKTIVGLDDLNVSIPLFSIITKIIFEPNGYNIADKFITCLTQYKI